MAYTANMIISDLLSTVSPRLKKMGRHDSQSTSTHWNRMRMFNVQSKSGFNPSTTKLFHPLEVSENNSDLTNGGERFSEILVSDVTFFI